MAAKTRDLNQRTQDSLDRLILQALALGAEELGELSEGERDRVKRVQPQLVDSVEEFRSLIEQSHDPLGESFCNVFSAADRRPKGAVYTPYGIVDSMLDWAEKGASPARVVDPGVGSGRFLVAAGRRFPDAELVGIDIDPVATLLAKAHLASSGLADRSRVLLNDYRQVDLGTVSGPTLFLGNPPYVRHHQIDDDWKRWLANSAKLYGLEASGLSGLHIYFFLATALHAQSDDTGVFITSSEWLDVNYGSLARDLLLDQLGLTSLQLLDPELEPFPGTQTTAVITGFTVGSVPSSIRVKQVRNLDGLTSKQPGRKVKRERFGAERRWTLIFREKVTKHEGLIELGEICRVHRGQVTGANNVWITTNNPFGLPNSTLQPTVTRAKELFEANGVLSDSRSLKRVIDLPFDLDQFSSEERAAIDAFLEDAKLRGADQGYVARNRKAWWSVGLKDPAPVLASYMARRSPVFVLNSADARHINIAHGLYPVEPLLPEQLLALTNFLTDSATTEGGRTYAGGLTKFEPREMERLLVPEPDRLLDNATKAS